VETELFQIVSNIGLAGGSVYAVIRLWSSLQSMMKRNDELQKSYTATVERLMKERAIQIESLRVEMNTEVNKLQNQKDDMQSQQLELLRALVVRVENGNS